MAAGSVDAVEGALNVLINVTEKSGYLRNDLRKDIFRAVSSLRKVFSNFLCNVEDKKKLILILEMKASGTNTTLRPLEFCCAADKKTTSPVFSVNWKLSSSTRRRKLYSDVVTARAGNEPHDNKM